MREREREREDEKEIAEEVNREMIECLIKIYWLMGRLVAASW